MDTEEVVRQALQTHLFWEKKLMAALKSGILIEDVKMVADPSLCSFGEWLEEMPPEKIESKEFVQVVEAHLHFHHCIAEICQRIMAGQTDFARQMIRVQYPCVSLEFMKSLDDLLKYTRKSF